MLYYIMFIVVLSIARCSECESQYIFLKWFDSMNVLILAVPSQWFLNLLPKQALPNKLADKAWFGGRVVGTQWNELKTTMSISKTLVDLDFAQHNLCISLQICQQKPHTNFFCCSIWSSTFLVVWRNSCSSSCSICRPFDFCSAPRSAWRNIWFSWRDFCSALGSVWLSWALICLITSADSWSPFSACKSTYNIKLFENYN